MDNKCKNNKVLFLIGNGFDLTHQLHTSYEDFYQYLSRGDDSNDEVSLLELLINTIGYRDKDGAIWSNFENSLEGIEIETDVKSIFTNSIGLYGYSEDKDPDYYSEQVLYQLREKQSIARSLPLIFSRWISTIDIAKVEKKKKIQ